MSQSYKIVTLPGDGIGPEVMRETTRVLNAATAACGLQIELQERHAGATLYRETGVALPDNILNDCLAADAVLLSAIGLPDVRKPDGTEVQPDMMVGLRRAMGLHSAVRPVKLYPGIESCLNTGDQGIDFVILRENLEGLFASFGGGCRVGDSVATDTMVITRDGTRKVCEYAFKLAARRKGRPSDGKRLVTCVDKANIFRSMAFFREVFFEVASEHPEIEAEATYVDAMSLYMVQNPSAYDVMVMENQFGDILSDLGAGIVGGLGMAPSAEIGEDHALFQPSHGTAPQIAGQNIANPIATIMSGAMMFDWLGERHADAEAVAVAQKIETAVQAVLTAGELRTADIGGSATTTAITDAIIQYL